ncbi:helix-turn-helix transcriptional regulator [Escherichia coli]|uniref:helix-turn-helix transcriptional regulator n=1 Tax=Escherichia coli TaxID=562 RepID=UPI000DE86B99|nr:helix-turn-helix transcriptional regulator [Escherichia coli]RBQ41205.1 hypothetical protein C2129_24210 [Escherichia coli]
MNNITALDRIVSLYSPVFKEPALNYSNNRLKNDVFIFIKNKNVMLTINNRQQLCPDKNTLYYIAKGTIITIQSNKKSAYEIYNFSCSETSIIYRMLTSLAVCPQNNILSCKYDNSTYTENSDYLKVDTCDGDLYIFRNLYHNISLLKKTYITLYFLSEHKQSNLSSFFQKKMNFSFSEKVKKILEEDLSISWRIADVSKVMLCSESTLRKKLLKENYTFNSMLLELRMNAAAIMILTTELHVNNIAKKVGYTGSSYFIKSFKDYYGITPKQLSLNVRHYNPLR